MAKQRDYLSKTLFVHSMECPMKLYYAKNDLYPTTLDEDLFNEVIQHQGHQVGELAKYYYPKGTEIVDLDQKTAIENSERELRKEKVTLFEAMIKWENCLLRPDILVKNGQKVDIIEVKSTSVKYEGQKFYWKNERKLLSDWKKYVYDVAFQTFVMRQKYPDLIITPYLYLIDSTKEAKVDKLNHMFEVVKNDNNSVTVNFKGDPKKLGKPIMILVKMEDYCKHVFNEIQFGKDKQSFADLILSLMKVAGEERPPKIGVGAKCSNCVYRTKTLDDKSKNGFRVCWEKPLNGNFNEPHVFDIWYPPKYLADDKIYFMKDLDRSILKNKGRDRRKRLQIVQTLKKDVSLETECIGDRLYVKMDEWGFPFHFLDFEAARIAIPFHKSIRPNQITAFQFSVHTVQKDGTVKHSKQWISLDRDQYPNFEFVRNLYQFFTENPGTIFCYSNYENDVLNEIHGQLKVWKGKNNDFKEIQKWIETITYVKKGNKYERKGENKMVDMLRLVQDYYYHPLLKGSNSIKAVIPTIFQISDFIKKKYSKPYENSLNYGLNHIWYQTISGNTTKDPYSLQISVDDKDNEYLNIPEGSAVVPLYLKSQLQETSKEEVEKIKEALLRYCELDTLSMVMIYEHWLSRKEGHSDCEKILDEDYAKFPYVKREDYV